MTNLLNQLESLPLVWALLIVGITPAVLLLNSKLLKRHEEAWMHEERGFKPIAARWRAIYYYSFTGGWTLSLVAGLLSEWNLYAILLIGILSHALIFSSMTDIIVHKAPKEVARYAIYETLFISALAIADQFINGSGGLVNPNAINSMPLGSSIWESQLYTVGFWMLIPVILLIVSRGGLGMADVRLLILFGVSLSWWVGLTGMLLAFFIANIMQILAFIPASKFNWGHMITMKNGKQKRAVPFIPALTLSFISIGIYTLSTF